MNPAGVETVVAPILDTEVKVSTSVVVMVEPVTVSVMETMVIFSAFA